MAVPQNRHEFKETCMRRLGWPDIDINLSDDAIEDRIDEALGFFLDFYYDGSEKTYYQYEVTQNDINNGYITLPDNFVGAISLFDLGSMYGTGDMFNITYQIALNDLWNLTNFDVVPYYMAMTHIRFLQEILTGKQPIRYNRLNNNFYIDTNWSSKFTAGHYDSNNVWIRGSFIVIEAYIVINPDQCKKVYADRWLGRYTTALIQKNWAQVLCVYTGLPMPGGMMINGDKMLAQANKEIETLEYELIHTYQEPPMMQLGLWILLGLGLTKLMEMTPWLQTLVT